jgi:hypothetical protein
VSDARSQVAPAFRRKRSARRKQRHANDLVELRTGERRPRGRAPSHPPRIGCPGDSETLRAARGGSEKMSAIKGRRRSDTAAAWSVHFFIDRGARRRLSKLARRPPRQRPVRPPSGLVSVAAPASPVRAWRSRRRAQQASPSSPRRALPRPRSSPRAGSSASRRGQCRWR